MTDKLEKLIEKINILSKKDYYKIKIIDKSPEIFESKIGGIPYWTPDIVYPTNSDGKKLFLLAQINFEKEKVESPLPSNGLIQFFISDDDVMGCQEDYTDQKNFRVIYHENIDYNITKESIKQLDVPDSKNAKLFPIIGEHKITLNKGIDYVNIQDIKFNDFFKIAYKEVYNKDLKDNDYYYKILTQEEQEEFENKMETDKLYHQMLGYAYFRQEDPRYDEKYSQYDTLLLQIDSEDKFTMWGEVGVGNFFISKNSLLNKDFSKVLYYWDCF